jgi:hypothetical protein
MAKRTRLMVTREKKVWVYVDKRDGSLDVQQERLSPLGCETRYPATLTWDEPAHCEGCGKPATTRDSKGRCVCGKCAKAHNAEAAKKAKR